MTGTRRLRASRMATVKRKRAETDARRELDIARDEGYAAGVRSGRRERDRKYELVCSTDDTMRTFNLSPPPTHDHVRVMLGTHPPVSFDDHLSCRYLAADSVSALFVPERMCWTDGHGNIVQWWNWKFQGVR